MLTNGSELKKDFALDAKHLLLHIKAKKRLVVPK